MANDFGCLASPHLKRRQCSRPCINWPSPTKPLLFLALTGTCMILDFVSASEMTYIVSGGALNSTHSLLILFYWVWYIIAVIIIVVIVIWLLHYYYLIMHSLIAKAFIVSLPFIVTTQTWVAGSHQLNPALPISTFWSQLDRFAADWRTVHLMHEMSHSATVVDDWWQEILKSI